jgi:hypothetical protein
MSDTFASICVKRTKLPNGLTVQRELGRGGNNRVYAALVDGEPCVLRAPRRRSDTQQRGSAMWEYHHLTRAAELGVAPRVRAVWFARHGTRDWPSGLYVVMDRYDDDLEKVLVKDTDLRPRLLDRTVDVGASVVAHLRALATDRLFVFDLKPSNVVLRMCDDGTADVRLIDFGCDFCEWCSQSLATEPTLSTPHIDMLRRRLGDDATPERVAHILFVAMLVVLSATTTRCLYEDRHRHRLGAAERAALHPFAALAAQTLDELRRGDLQLVRELLRMDEVRGVLRHYHGRRDAGTGRTLAYARGVEHAP